MAADASVVIPPESTFQQTLVWNQKRTVLVTTFPDALGSDPGRMPVSYYPPWALSDPALSGELSGLGYHLCSHEKHLCPDHREGLSGGRTTFVQVQHVHYLHWIQSIPMLPPCQCKRWPLPIPRVFLRNPLPTSLPVVFSIYLCYRLFSEKFSSIYPKFCL